MKERNLNNFREDKQREEEKNIDLITKKKIYSSRMNIANTEVQLEFFNICYRK